MLPAIKTVSTSQAAAHTNTDRLKAALALHRQGQLDQAEILYKKILQSTPGHFDALQLLAAIAVQRQEYAAAVVLFDLALAIDPHKADVHNNRGIALAYLKRPEQALHSYDLALKIKPAHAQAHNNRGNALRDLQRPLEALASYDQALAINFDQAEVHTHRGMALGDLKRPVEALASYAEALRIEPDHADAHWNEGLCRLLMGDFARGWQKYEWRWKVEQFAATSRRFAQTLWLGQEPLRGKTILLHSEQGLGDTIQFCRYAREVAALGAIVVLEVPAALKTLLSNLDGVAMLLSQGDSLPQFDYHCPLLSLPLAFQSDLNTIRNGPYLRSDPQKRVAWLSKLPDNKKKKVGLVWQGGAKLKNDVNRSIAFDALSAALHATPNEHIDYYCLQKEVGMKERLVLEKMQQIAFFGAELHDFSDTAALLDLMDLVITVDTSIAHLAGAMGKPVWILLPFNPDWRWLLERVDSPWYQSARLFRQSAIGDWPSVLAQVAVALKKAGPSTAELMPRSTSSSAGLPARADTAKFKHALAMHQQGHLSQAEALYKQILLSQPHHFDALQLLATIAVQRNEHAAAVLLFDQALAINPQQAVVHNNRGIALAYLKRPEQALQSYDRALQLQPGHAQAHNNRGNALRDLKRPLEALASYEQALAIDFHQADVHNNRGMALGDLKRPEQALHSYEQALRIKPDDAEAHYNRANVLLEMKRPAQALQSYEQVLLLKPDYAEAHSNRGKALLDLQRPAQALQSFELARQFQPDYADVHLNESLCRLLMADFATGWQKHEWRWKTEKGVNTSRGFTQALWLGQTDLKSKTILLHSEQGLGDTIQFCRYASQVAALGATVLLEVQAPLKPLLHAIDGVSRLFCHGDALPEFDYHCPLLSLPLAFQTSLSTISGKPYLQSDLQKRTAWHAKLQQNHKKRVGLAWSGSLEHGNDANRSIALSQLNTILNNSVNNSANQDIDYYCLQKEVRLADQLVLEQMQEIVFFGAELNDFSDTAALIALMDLVITVDTSVAHLAGAMGKEVWILLPFNPDWRWLLERTDSPWYNSVRLFRQPALDDWASVLDQVGAELQRTFSSPAETMATVVAATQASMATLKDALALHQQGHLNQAEVLYKQLLQSQPQHFDALQLLATIAVQRNDCAAAILLFDQALGIDPHQADVHNNRGIALGKLKQPLAALDSYERALLLEPQHDDAYNNRGNALRELQRPLEALASYDQTLKLKPDHVEAHNNRGLALIDLQRPAEALHSHQQALLLQPSHADAHYNCGNALRDMKQFAQALDSYDRALLLKPGYAQAHNNRGYVLLELKRPLEALTSYEQALLLKPGHGDTLYNLGNALRELNRAPEALERYDQALQRQPDHVDAHNNRGLALSDLKRPQEARQSYERALKIAPDHANAHWNDSLCRLLMGDLTAGWKKYESRWKTENGVQTARTFAQPLWLGQADLTDKTILLYREQGLGDTIQFCRYASQVAALGASVLLQVQAPLMNLLHDLDGVAMLLCDGDALPQFDYHCPLLSLPLAFQTQLNTISNAPYLHSDLQKRAAWRSKLHENTKKRVGLVWRGSAQHKNDANRSIGLAQLHAKMSATTHQHIDYYCLQKELSLADQAYFEQTRQIAFFGSELHDFSDTAALLEWMDLVITVDTTVAHLAGAMGKEVWILLPFNPDWRWLLERADSPWYQSARLFRQPALKDWDSVLTQVGVALEQRFLISRHMQ